MTEPTPDEYILLKNASEHFISKPHLYTIERWTTEGFVPRGKVSKKPIVLKTFCEGDVIYTTQRWINKFRDDCTARRKTRKKK